jgi:hypothetical protein
LPASAGARHEPDLDGCCEDFVYPTGSHPYSGFKGRENSFRGGYTVNGGPVDPSPPAFLRGSQMRVGLVNAAEHSPALRTCGPSDAGGGGGGGGGDDYGGGSVGAG